MPMSGVHSDSTVLEFWVRRGDLASGAHIAIAQQLRRLADTIEEGVSPESVDLVILNPVEETFDAGSSIWFRADLV